ncbi:hypothetical protein BHE74_00031681 [Ensete ventricosum]|nr:hypothetical protein BHE74_00031681 [Ensete ventricosum]RZS02347.1 hypothetical protein BHM03_00032391 [Ensete ventricosum]
MSSRCNAAIAVLPCHCFCRSHLLPTKLHPPLSQHSHAQQHYCCCLPTVDVVPPIVTSLAYHCPLLPLPLIAAGIGVPSILAVGIDSNRQPHHCCSSSSPPSSLPLAPATSFSLPLSLFPGQQITALGDLGDAAPSRTTTASSLLQTLIATTVAIFLLRQPHPHLLAAAQPPLLSLPS